MNRTGIVNALIGLLLTLALPRCANSQTMEYPLAVAAAADGSLYVADRNLPGIWKIQDGVPSVYFQASKTFRTPLNAVRCLAVDASGTLYAGDSSTREVYRFDASGKPQPLTTGGIGIPMAIALNSKGNLLVADLEQHKIFEVPSAGGKATEFAKVQAPRGLAIDGKDRVWVLSNSKQPLVRIDENRKTEVLIEEAMFEFTHQLVLDGEETAYFCDGYAKTLWKMKAGGKPEKMFVGEPLKNPVGLGLAGDQLLVADPHQKTIYTLPKSGATTLVDMVKK
jgi:hypothetical protein